MKGPFQRSLYCPCGNEKILALGLCSTCYTLKRQDEEYFGGHREEVLARDGYRCRIPNCATVKRGKRSVAVHHRRPGNSDPKLMITLCLPCHAKVSRTQFLETKWPELLCILWREQHPEAHEQITLDFKVLTPAAAAIPLFEIKVSQK
ncbi:hypothetical protein HDF16_004943 [Granulicella aggregans]|uniref:HNH endonuclease n=1 Tax=Granulicella aggregans TaxID=474949 RepID=A0A7W7ZI00_9BACT|nr:HNH endonuclease [Granulicella aggregans]MBB5060207.1 hypothetical protein [Granulicella aggregans]